MYRCRYYPGMDSAALRRLGGPAAAALVAAGFVVLAMGRFSGGGGGDPPRRPVVTIPVGHDSSMIVPPGQSRELEFRLPPRVCTMTGQLDAAGVGSSRFEALVLDDDEFSAWTKQPGSGSVRSGVVTSWSPRLTLVGPGRFHLVLWNPERAATVEVAIRQAKATCP
ncbi:MAG: hypothetical protein ACREK8_06660 [Gemmatimonadales bacterium]